MFKFLINLLAFVFIRLPISIIEISIMLIGIFMGVFASAVGLAVTIVIAGFLLFGCGIILLFV